MYWPELSCLPLGCLKLTGHFKGPVSAQLTAAGSGAKQLIPTLRHFLPWLNLCVSQDPKFHSLLREQVKNPRPVTYHSDPIA